MSDLENLRSFISSNNVSDSNILSDDGKTLTLGNNNKQCDASVKYTIPDTSNEYSLASLYLVCKFKDLGLLKLRRECAKYKVEMVKTTDQKWVFSYFGLVQQNDDSAASENQSSSNNNSTLDKENDIYNDINDTIVSIAAPGDSTSKNDKKDVTPSSSKKRPSSVEKEKSKSDKKRSKDDRRHSSSRERSKHHRKDRDHRSSSNKDRGASDKGEKASAAKKDKTPMTNKQILENLSSLQSKREGDRKRKANDITSSMMDVTQDEEGETTRLDDQGTETDGVSQTPKKIIDGSQDESANILSQTDSGHIMASQGDNNTAEALYLTNAKADDLQKKLIEEALSTAGFDFSEDVIAADREATEKITTNETPVGDSVSILRFASRDFSRVLGLYNEVDRQQNKTNRHASIPNSLAPKSAKDIKKKVGLPLIIIPSSQTYLIGMVNAKQFFSDRRYVPRSGCSQRVDLSQKLTFKRKIANRLGGGEVEYEIMDNPNRLKSSAEWDRIVAVVALGQAWQFRSWKWKEPVEIFSKTFGFYIGLDGAPLPKDLTAWNVKKATLSPHKRGLDSVAYTRFWNG